MLKMKVGQSLGKRGEEWERLPTMNSWELGRPTGVKAMNFGTFIVEGVKI